MDFAKRLKSVREKLGYSQEKMAKELDVSFATINRLEKGKTLPSYATIIKLEEFCKKNNLRGEQ